MNLLLEIKTLGLFNWLWFALWLNYDEFNPKLTAANGLPIYTTDTKPKDKAMDLQKRLLILQQEKMQAKRGVVR